MIQRMERYGVIERANSPYISPLVTITKDGRVCLCFDTRKINSLSESNYEGPNPIQEMGMHVAVK